MQKIQGWSLIMGAGHRRPTPTIAAAGRSIVGTLSSAAGVAARAIGIYSIEAQFDAAIREKDVPKVINLALNNLNDITQEIIDRAFIDLINEGNKNRVLYLAAKEIMKTVNNQGKRI